MISRKEGESHRDLVPWQAAIAPDGSEHLYHVLLLRYSRHTTKSRAIPADVVFQSCDQSHEDGYAPQVGGLEEQRSGRGRGKRVQGVPYCRGEKRIIELYDFRLLGSLIWESFMG